MTRNDLFAEGDLAYVIMAGGKASSVRRRMTCATCGRQISFSRKKIRDSLRGTSYYFDSKECLLIFGRLRQLHGDVNVKKFLA